RIVFASGREMVEKAIEAAGRCPQGVLVVSFDLGADDIEGVVPWRAFLERGRTVSAGWSEESYRARALAVGPHDVATILYTSGTTGTPKGVVLTHNNIASNVRAARMVLEVSDADSTVSFLPLSHI